MGTEILYPHDVLASRRLGSSPSTAGHAFLPRRRTTPAGCLPNPRPQRRPESKKRREGAPRNARSNGGGCGGLEMGRVTILRRGEALESMVKAKEERRGKAGAAGDSAAFTTGRIGPEPTLVPKLVPKLVRLAKASAGRAETYAGPAFSMSPSPRALPLPTFSSRKVAGGGEDAVDLCATRDLRQLLRLD